MPFRIYANKIFYKDETLKNNIAVKSTNIIKEMNELRK